MKEPPNHRPPWSWQHFVAALALLPLSFAMWLVGLDAAFRPEQNRSSIALLGLMASRRLAGYG